MNTSLADVALPVPLPQLFTYSIPAHLASVIARGTGVIVPFGRKILTGIVVDFPQTKPAVVIKTISDVADLQPMVNVEDLQLARWISEYYHAPLGETMRLFLPPGFGHTSKRIITLSESYSELMTFTGQQQKVINCIQNGATTIRQLEKATGIKNLYAIIRDLSLSGAIAMTEQRAKKTSAKKLWYFTRISDEASVEFRGNKQREAWNTILSLENLEYETTLFLKTYKSTLATLRSLATKHLISIYQKEVERREIFTVDEHTAKSLTIRMNNTQEECVNAITAQFETSTQKTFLLHGITGSGKTQVYIESIRRILERGKTAIVLIPEISLTPQTVKRFQVHFGNNVVWMHSRMSDGERHDAWRSIRAGMYSIVIGPRSALFAPLKNIGLIIVDEEHESSYKQFDASPRYNARDVAIVRSAAYRAVVVLGSATPSIESYANALQGRYTLLTLPERADNAVLPPVTIVNMVDERKRLFADAKMKAKELGKKAFDNLSRSISPLLESKIRDRLEKKEGIILLQNRRGFAPFIECTSCGHVEQCDHCNVTMTYHATKKHMRCHYCGKVKPPPTVCPQCGGFEFSMSGFGTQRVEQELTSLFPTAIVSRMDMDTTSQKGSHEKILRHFGEGGANILLGTQMVAKGLDFPRVTLVGVISADTQMMLPDFRSAEKTFQLLTQVAGRAGRSTLAGEVVIQTSQPKHYALKYVQEHDFVGFYTEEVEYRRSINYPPFSRIIVIEFKGKNESAVERLAQEAGKRLFTLLKREFILGPSPAVLSKIKNDYRWQIIIKASKELDQNGTRARHSAARVAMELQSSAIKQNVKIIVDVDPTGIL
ncbi:MAG: primosomal protein N' [Bacteriovoracaceae bacterium]|nr:primosomal protein N' [Bacteroidota bacterium]